MPTPNLIGQHIHHYEILSHLGGGGMGVVYKAKDTKLGRTVALKFLAPQLTSDPDLKKRFVQEAKAASALDHPNIGVVHDINETQDGQLFITMAYYEGETLKDKIAQGPIPVDQAIDYAAQIAKGLAKAHEADIVHRDIKPANIIITKDNTVKIVDFGLAKMTGETQLTKTGSTIGTIAYMSPEQLKGEEVDHRTDIWSLGVVLYEMVMGERPFGGEFEHAVIYGILHDELNVANVPEEARDRVQGALQKEVADRYPSAHEMVHGFRSPAHRIGSAREYNSKDGKKVFSLLRTVVIGILVLGSGLLGYFVVTGSKAPSNPQSIKLETQLTFEGNAFMPTLSPDGELIVYEEVLSDSTSRIVIRERTGGQPRELLNGVIYSANSDRKPRIRWSPDGKLIGVSVRKSRDPFSPFSFHLFSRLGVSLPSTPLLSGWFSWSPDASQIAALAHDTLQIFDTKNEESSFYPVEIPYDHVFHLEWSPSGKYLLFETTDSSGTKMWTMDESGKNLQTIYETEHFAYSPRWDKNSENVYFLEVEGTEIGLRKLPVSPHNGDARGSAATVHTGFGNVRSFSLSADNRRLVFDGEPIVMNFWRFDLGESEASKMVQPRQLTSLTSIKWAPRISPDGTELAFYMQNVSGFDVYTMRISDGVVQQLTFMGSTSIVGPTWLAWGPGGEQIAWLNRPGDNAELHTVKLDGGQIESFALQSLPSNRMHVLDWNNGEKILYSKSDNSNIVLFDPGTGTSDLLLHQDTSLLGYPVYSPDGKSIAFLSTSVSPNRYAEHISIISLEDRLITTIYSTQRLEESILPLRWAEDGQWIFGIMLMNKAMHIYKVAVDGSEHHHIATIPATIGLDIAPNGSFAIGALLNETSDIRMLEHFDPDVE